MGGFGSGSSSIGMMKDEYWKGGGEKLEGLSIDKLVQFTSMSEVSK